jgi:hypothetical protein
MHKPIAEMMQENQEYLEDAYNIHLPVRDGLVVRYCIRKLNASLSLRALALPVWARSDLSIWYALPFHRERYDQ